jgi:biotin-dependent carboxylase-like uncharacterized protein
MIEIVNQGIGSSFQDLGRGGLKHLGVGRSGAADRPSHDLANRLVGNGESIATIETCGGLTVRFHRHAIIVVTGASGPLDVRHGPPMAVNGVAHMPVGSELTLRPPDGGVRYYLAVRGGFEVEPVLGSCSLDTLAGIGPRLSSGDRIDVGSDPMSELTADFVSRQPLPTLIDVHEGPRRDWFTEQAWATFIGTDFVVSPSGNRIGARLTGQVLERRETRELPREGLVEGAVQVPPDGQPIVMLADHPVTGGYPVIAVVAKSHIPAVVQARHGTALRFRHSIG